MKTLAFPREIMEKIEHLSKITEEILKWVRKDPESYVKSLTCAKMVNRSLLTLKHWRDKGGVNIPFIKVRNYYQYKLSDIYKYLDSNEKKR